MSAIKSIAGFVCNIDGGRSTIVIVSGTIVCVKAFTIGGPGPLVNLFCERAAGSLPKKASGQSQDMTEHALNETARLARQSVRSCCRQPTDQVL